MRHLATISQGLFDGRPVHIECSCGSAGDFADEDSARRWMQGHFDNLSGIAYGEFAADQQAEPAEPA